MERRVAPLHDLPAIVSGREIKAKDLGLIVWIQKIVARNESYDFVFLPSFF